MGTDVEGKLEKIVLEINGIGHDTFSKKIKKVPKIIYVLDVGGSLLRRYQSKLAQQMGWKEKNLTTANAVIFGLGGSAVYLVGAYFFRDDLNDSARHLFYYYHSFNIAQSLFRITYSQITRKAIGSISMLGVLFNPIYATKDLVNYLKNRKRR